jgi:hypothetical protein
MKDCGLFAALFFAVACLVSCRREMPVAPDRESITGAVNAFHAALAEGNEGAAVTLLAPDVQILEEGARQSRDEYLHEHLGADIAFAKAVPSKRSAMIVRQEGTTAWTTATTESKGTFMGREINSAGTELMVLSQTPEGWRIRAIHWSSHANR